MYVAACEILPSTIGAVVCCSNVLPCYLSFCPFLRPRGHQPPLALHSVVWVCFWLFSSRSWSGILVPCSRMQCARELLCIAREFIVSVVLKRVVKLHDISTHARHAYTLQFTPELTGTVRHHWHRYTCPDNQRSIGNLLRIDKLWFSGSDQWMLTCQTFDHGAHCTYPACYRTSTSEPDDALRGAGCLTCMDKWANVVAGQAAPCQAQPRALGVSSVFERLNWDPSVTSPLPRALLTAHNLRMLRPANNLQCSHTSHSHASYVRQRRGNLTHVIGVSHGTARWPDIHPPYSS